MSHSGVSVKTKQPCAACGGEHNVYEMVLIIDPRPERSNFDLCLPCFDDHYVVFTADSWTVEHSFACRLSGAMVECPYHAIQEIADEPHADLLGRWRIVDIDEGLPSLVRA